MISWQSIMSVFNTKGTLLKWLKTLDQSLKDGVLQSVTVNPVSTGVITLTFNFADGSTITTPQIDIPQGAQGPQGVPGQNGADGESFNPRGEWVTDNEYHPFDYVTYQGSSYLCTETIIDGTDAPPLDTAHWQLVAEKGDQGEPGTGPDIPTPTTADNGKVLGVTNGAYALQEASGGGGTQLYLHRIQTDEDGAGFVTLCIVCNYNQKFKSFLDVFDKCSPSLNTTPDSCLCSVSGTFKIWGSSETDYIECGIVSFLGKIPGLLIYDKESSSLRVLTRSYLSESTVNIISDTVIPL